MSEAIEFSSRIDAATMTDLRDVSERLRSLGAKPPTRESRAEVIAGLSSKWEGIQAGSVVLLAGWEDRESISSLRPFLIQCFSRKYGWAIRGVVVRALRPVVTSEDVEWVLDLYFGLPGGGLKHELLWLVAGLPPQTARTRLLAALSDPHASNRHAAVKAIGNMNYPDRRQLLQRLHADPDEHVRRSVRVFVPNN